MEEAAHVGMLLKALGAEEGKGGDGRRGWSGGDQRGKGGRRECEQEIVKREGRSKISGRQQAKSAVSFRPITRVG